MHLVSTFLLYTDYPTSTPNHKNPSWWRPKGLIASRVTPDKITATTMSFYGSVLLPSYITNRYRCSLAATIPPHSTMSFHLFFTPTMLLINTTLYNHTIKYNACLGPTTYFIYKIKKISSKNRKNIPYYIWHWGRKRKNRMNIPNISSKNQAQKNKKNIPFHIWFF